MGNKEIISKKNSMVEKGQDANVLQYTLARDVKVIEVTKRLRGIRKTRNWFAVLFVLTSCFIFTGIIFISLLSYNMQETISQITTEQRTGLYELNKAIVKDAPSYEERLEIFCKKGKAFILQIYEKDPPVDKLTDYEINQFLIIVFRYSEQYMVDPWIAMSFARVESCFSRLAVSYAGAKGIFQIMPFMSKALMGNDYYDGCEFDLNLSTKMFFKMYLYLSPVFNNDLNWISAAYLFGTYYPLQFYNSGRPFQDYYEWFKTVDEKQAGYMHKIEETYKAVKDL